LGQSSDNHDVGGGFDDDVDDLAGFDGAAGGLACFVCATN